MEFTTMVQTLIGSDLFLENDKLEKGLNQIGLKLSESELNHLNTGKTIFLDNIELGKIGSIFIMASALFAKNQLNSKKSMTFEKLSKKVRDCFSGSGITLYCWNSESISEKHCLYFTLIDGIPALKICCRVRAIN